MYRPLCENQANFLEGGGSEEKKLFCLLGLEVGSVGSDLIGSFCYMNLMSLNFQSWSNP